MGAPKGAPVSPPSTISSTALMYDGSSEARKSTALARSSGSPQRASGTVEEKKSETFADSSASLRRSRGHHVHANLARQGLRRWIAPSRRVRLSWQRRQLRLVDRDNCAPSMQLLLEGRLSAKKNAQRILHASSPSQSTRPKPARVARLVSAPDLAKHPCGPSARGATLSRLRDARHARPGDRGRSPSAARRLVEPVHLG